MFMPTASEWKVLQILEVIDDGTKSEVEVRVHFAEADAAGE